MPRMLRLRALKERRRTIPASHCRWVATPSALSCVHGNVLVLLSLRTGQYHTLNGTGILIWESIQSGATRDEIAMRVVAHYGMPEGRVAVVRTDVARILWELQIRGLIEATSGGSPMSVATVRAARSDVDRATEQREPQVASVLRCMATLLVICFELRYRGTFAVLRRIGRLRPTYVCDVPAAWFSASSRNIAVAASALPFSARCLERSLCLLFLALQAGGDAVLRIGVLPFNFNAHAWVEYKGAPVNDDVEFLRLFRPFPAVRPGDI
jgi:hypothetical protein